VAGVAFVIGGRTVAANPVINGSFEADGQVAYSPGGILPPITGWTSSGQRVAIYNAYNPPDGNYVVVFDDGSNTSTPPSGTHTGQISQTVPVAPNSTYAVFYKYGMYSPGGIHTQRVQVQAGTLNHIDFLTGNFFTPVYTQRGHTLGTDGSGTVNLSFKDATISGEIAAADGILDAVSMHRVAYSTSFEVGESNYTITSSNATPAHAVIWPDPNYGGQAKDGSQFLAFNGGGVGENEGNAIVTSDAFATLPGLSGFIYLDFGNYAVPNGNQSILIEMIDASTSIPYFSTSLADNSGTSAAYTVIDGYVIPYTAQAASSRIRITDTSGAATPASDGLLDNIIVTLPEPGAALGFGALAMSILGTRGRRRRPQGFEG
jgi:hypothetical protein